MIEGMILCSKDFSPTGRESAVYKSLTISNAQVSLKLPPTVTTSESKAREHKSSRPWDLGPGTDSVSRWKYLV